MSLATGVVPLATARTEIGEYLEKVIYVYILLIVAYIIVQLILGLGGYRPAYSRTTDAILKFLRDVSEPYLRIFRRLIPGIAGFDFSPMIGIFVLLLVKELIVSDLIKG